MHFATSSVTANKCSCLKLDVTKTKRATPTDVIFTLYYLPFSFSCWCHTHNHRFFVVLFSAKFQNNFLLKSSKNVVSSGTRNKCCSTIHCNSNKYLMPTPALCDSAVLRSDTIIKFCFIISADVCHVQKVRIFLYTPTYLW